MKVNISGGVLNVDVRGSGELVVLHPTAARSVSDLDMLANDLVSAGYMTAAINQRGVGGSTGSTKEITMRQLADDIAAVIKTIDAGPAHAIGHAFSSSFVRVLAEYWPELVRSVIPLTVSGVLPSKTDALNAIECILTLEPSDKERQEAIKSVFFAETSDASPWYDGFYNEVLRDLFLWPLSTTPQSEWLKGGKAPMLIVQGTEDKLAPPGSGEMMKEMKGLNGIGNE